MKVTDSKVLDFPALLKNEAYKDIIEVNKSNENEAKAPTLEISTHHFFKHNSTLSRIAVSSDQSKSLATLLSSTLSNQTVFIAESQNSTYVYKKLD